MKKQICHSLITLLAVVFLGSSFSAHPAFAESGDTFDSFDNFSCSAGLGYVGAINTQNESYDLYLKLGKPLQSEKVTLTYSQSTNCKKFKNITANGITWSKIGTINADSTNKASFTLEANFINNLPDANRPTLMLVPTKKPPCKPKKQCVISSIQGVTTHIEPTGTSFNQEDLHIVKVIDPKTDSIASVDYFVDNDFMYSSTNPEPFDKRYMPIGSHTVYTINNYKSGQKVVKSEVLDQGVASGFKNFVFTIFYKNKSALDILTGLVIILSFLSILVSVIHKIYKKRLWLVQHDASKYSSVDSSTKIMGKIYNGATLVKRLTPLILIFTALVLAIKIVPTHGLRIVNVDGVSMTYTFKDKEPMVVSKIGKSWSMFNGQTYIPKRGQVIIFKREQSAFLKPDELSKPSYVVKRVIALPGEKVTVKNGHVRVYTSSKPKGFDPDKGAVWEKTMRKAGFGEDLTITVDKDEVFVLGDNRTGSIDSRYNGPVKLNDIYGHVRWHGKLTSLKSA